MRNQSMRSLRTGMLLAVMAAFFLLGGCKSKEEALLLRELEYTVLAKENIPEPLLEELEARKKEEFRITYEDGEYLYLCVGYGQQDCGGYSIQVKQMSLYEGYILLDTTLLGPESEDVAQQVSSYPYLVLRTELLEDPVVFE